MERNEAKLHRELCDRAVRWLIRMGCTAAVAEITTTATAEICDAVGWCGGVSVVVEVKTSRADFLRDKKKPHRQLGSGMGGYRYYMAPAGLIKPDEIPEGWGLVEVAGKICRILKGPTRLSPWSEEIPFNTRNHQAEAGLLASLVRRLRDGEPSAQRIATKKHVALDVGEEEAAALQPKEVPDYEAVAIRVAETARALEVVEKLADAVKEARELISFKGQDKQPKAVAEANMNKAFKILRQAEMTYDATARQYINEMKAHPTKAGSQGLSPLPVDERRAIAILDVIGAFDKTSEADLWRIVEILALHREQAMAPLREALEKARAWIADDLGEVGYEQTEILEHDVIQALDKALAAHPTKAEA